MKQPKKTAIYCRTAFADEGGIAAQEARLRAYARENGHADAIPYRDSGAAGNSLDRPAMNALTTDIRAGRIGAVLVTDISRIARTLPLVSEWRKLLFEHGVKLVILTSGETPRPAIDIAYIPAGDYLLPNIALAPIPAEEKQTPFGRYARMRRAFLKEHRPIESGRLLLSEQLFPHLRDVDAIADGRRRSGASESVIVKEIVCE